MKKEKQFRLNNRRIVVLTFLELAKTEFAKVGILKKMDQPVFSSKMFSAGRNSCKVSLTYQRKGAEHIEKKSIHKTIVFFDIFPNLVFYK